MIRTNYEDEAEFERFCRALSCALTKVCRDSGERLGICMLATGLCLVATFKFSGLPINDLVLLFESLLEDAEQPLDDEAQVS